MCGLAPFSVRMGKPFNALRRNRETCGPARLKPKNRAFKVVSDKSSELAGGPAPRNRASHCGLARSKYADLLPNRQSDYVFSWTKCWRFTATQRPTFNTLTPASAASSARVIWIRARGATRTGQRSSPHRCWTSHFTDYPSRNSRSQNICSTSG